MLSLREINYIKRIKIRDLKEKHYNISIFYITCLSDFKEIIKKNNIIYNLYIIL
jgi:hypothetical protein